MTYRILVTDPINDSGLDVLKSAQDATTDVLNGLSPAELNAKIAEYDAIITRSGTSLDGRYNFQQRNK